MGVLLLKWSRLTLSEDKNLNQNLIFREHLSTFRAECKLKRRNFRYLQKLCLNIFSTIPKPPESPVNEFFEVENGQNHLL